MTARRPTSAPKAVVSTLLCAVGSGDAPAVRRLLAEYPGIVNAVGHHPYWGGYCQPLHVALDTNRGAMVTLLLRHGADVNGTNDRYAGWSPLMIALAKGRRVAQRQLQARGARIGLAEALLLGDDRRVLALLRKGRVALRQPVPGRGSWLGLARTPAAIDRLLALGASVRRRDQWGTDPMEGFSRQGPRGKPLVRHLAALGYPVPPAVFGRLNDRPSLARLARTDPARLRDPLVIKGAVDFKHHALVEWLLGRGADVNARATSKAQETLLHSAAWNGDTKMVQLLMDHGADLQARDHEYDATPHSWALTAVEVTNNAACAVVADMLLARGAT